MKQARRPAPKRVPPPAKPDPALELFALMLKIRLAEQKIIELYPSDKIQSPVHLSIGQEATAVGVCRAMGPLDHIYGTYRGHGVYIAKGGGLKGMFAELYGKDTGCARGKGGSMHLVAPEVGLMGCSAIVSSLIPPAVGDALASSLQGRQRISVALFGDGAMDEGVYFESVNFALLKNLPVLFVCENNGYAIHSKVADRRKQTRLTRLTEGFGLPARQYDGNDVFAVHDQTSKALSRIRKGGGPELLEFSCFRWNEHVGPGVDYAEAYRRPGEKARALAADPLEKARSLLRRRFRVTAEQFQACERGVRAEIDEAVRYAEESPFPGADQLLAGVYAAR